MITTVTDLHCRLPTVHKGTTLPTSRVDYLTDAAHGAYSTTEATLTRPRTKVSPPPPDPTATGLLMRPRSQFLLVALLFVLVAP